MVRRRHPSVELLAELADGVEQLRDSVGELRGASASSAHQAIESLLKELQSVRSTIASNGGRPERQVLDELAASVASLFALAPAMSGHASKRTRDALTRIVAEISRLTAILDPIREPLELFDPAQPDSAGRLVALALVEQPRLDLARVGKMYGSGVYAIYYEGDHPAYAPISGTETPIYVGKADPENPHAKTAREQGPRLTGRLIDHRRMIRTAEAFALNNPDANNPPIRIKDFRYRRLVVATNAQLVAERHLISIFRPAWNKETNICWGISKHGDAAAMRGHGRSPWDVMHPGRPWAAESTTDMVPRAIIAANLEQHFRDQPIYRTREAIVDEFLKGFRQTAIELKSEAEATEEDAVEGEEEGPVE